MIVDIAELRESKEPLQLELDFSDEQLNLRNHISSLREPAQARLRVSLQGNQVRVQGKLKVELELTCSRCLETFTCVHDKGFDLEYWPDPVVETDSEEIALTYPELTIGFYRDEQLDLSAVISEQIVLEIPMKPVCREECRGLCDQCGANLNEFDCGCRRDLADPRMAVLMQLKKKMARRD